MSDDDGWEDYSSEFMFPGEGGECTCDHLPHEHNYDSCEVDDCDCDAHWEHT